MTRLIRGAAVVLACVLVAGLAVGAEAVFPAAARATPEYAASTGRQCAYCHTTPGGPLTAEGQAFKDNGYVLSGDTTTSTSAGPEATSGAPGSTGSTTPEAPGIGGGPSTPAGPALTLPTWLRTFLRWAHLVAVVAWLGAIVFVHVVQTPKVAGRGIPRGYLKLAWPSILVVGVSGLLLTLGDVSGLSALPDHRWGRLLLTKIGIYLLLVCVAFVVTLVISPRLRRVSDAERPEEQTHEELRTRGRVTFSYQGKVYDVTGSRLWREGRHAKRHAAWQDLTTSLGGAPHGTEVFERFPVVGGAPVAVPRVARVFVVMAYLNLFLVLAVLLVVAAW